MATAPKMDEGNEMDAGRTTTKYVIRRSLITGTAILIPLAVTALVLSFAINFVSTNFLGPVAEAIRTTQLIPNQANQIAIEIATGIVFLFTVFAIGFVAEFTPEGGRLSDQFDELMAAIPGIGSVYTSFDEMSEMLLDDDTESFQEVKLVEYPGEASYVVAFKTSDTPGVIERDTGHEEMETLFMPMAPNPVMGGFVIHVSSDRVVDVDMTVEQGIQSIVTSGVAFGGDDPELRGLTAREMREIGQVEAVEGQTDPSLGSPSIRHEPTETAKARREEYDGAVSPEHSETPEKIAERADAEESVSSTEAATPAELAQRRNRHRGTTDDSSRKYSDVEETE